MILFIIVDTDKCADRERRTYCAEKAKLFTTPSTIDYD
jgi:hypothetical protein